MRLLVLGGTRFLGRHLVEAALARGDDVTIFTRGLPDDHVIYALFIAPGQDYGQLKGTFARMMGSLRVNDEAHR